jgi:hypothetical protein
MTTNYKIYVVNQSETTQIFWCFLARPHELADDPGVFANSSASLAVAPNYPANACFDIPVQYVVGAGASNRAVGLNVRVVSNVMCDASLQQQFEADYAMAPPMEGPTMSLSGTSPPNTIALQSNGYNQGANEEIGWFSNMSFGIQSDAGFTGMTWSPNQQSTRTLTPVLKFYVSTGNYGSNTLATWDDISSSSTAITVPDSFQDDCCTVTLASSGSWILSPGHPAPELLGSTSEGGAQMDVIQSVSWNQMAAVPEGTFTSLSGILTVSAALGARFTYFVLSGVTFSIVNAQPGQTTFAFRYSGTKSARMVMSLFRAGAQLALGGA